MASALVAALRRREIRLLMAFIIGFGIATLLRSPCQGYLCRKFVAPDLKLVEDSVWRHGTGCLKVRLNSTSCAGHAGDIIPSL